MANTKSANSGTKPTALERSLTFSTEKSKFNFEKAEKALRSLRDATKSYTANISIFNKDSLRSYLKNIGANEKNLRNVSRFLYYRSHIYFRLVRFYASMPDLRVRQVIPKYELGSTPNEKTFMKDYGMTLDELEKINNNLNMAGI